MLIRENALVPVQTPGGNVTSGLATPSRGAAEVSVIRQRQVPGGQNPPHLHDREEVMVMREGVVTVAVGAERFTLAAGDTLIVPPQTAHQIENTGTLEAEWLLIAPAGVRFLRPDGEESHPEWAR